jgi:GT2 family glycosyltransferase
VAENQVQCVIVLYKSAPAESRAVCSLLDCVSGDAHLAEQLEILIYDNSPTVQHLETTQFNRVEYQHDPQNGGLARAYNYALELTQRKHINWLLLLDQDTALEAGFFASLLREINAPPPANTCAIVPKLMQDGTILSPQIVRKFRNASISSKFSGTCSGPLTALNSAACLRVQAVTAIGGFPREYWLDYLDHAMFYRLQAAGGRIMVLDIVIEHHLSLMNLRTEMSITRYSNILAAEWRFIRETGSGGGSLIHRLRLLKRAFGLLLKNSNRAYVLNTFRASFS